MLVTMRSFRCSYVLMGVWFSTLETILIVEQRSKADNVRSLYVLHLPFQTQHHSPPRRPLPGSLTRVEPCYLQLVWALADGKVVWGWGRGSRFPVPSPSLCWARLGDGCIPLLTTMPSVQQPPSAVLTPGPGNSSFSAHSSGLWVLTAPCSSCLLLQPWLKSRRT